MNEPTPGDVKQITCLDPRTGYFINLNELAVQEKIACLGGDFRIVGFLRLVGYLLSASLSAPKNNLLQWTEFLVRRAAKLGELTVRCIFERFANSVPVALV